MHRPVRTSDRGMPYLAVRYTERLAGRGRCRRLSWKQGRQLRLRQPRRSTAGSRPSSCPTGPWKDIDDFEIAVAEYIDRFNFRRLPGEIGLIPPVEWEDLHRSTTLPEQPAHRQFYASIKAGT